VVKETKQQHSRRLATSTQFPVDFTHLIIEPVETGVVILKLRLVLSDANLDQGSISSSALIFSSSSWFMA
jgi:hypothetical protein